MIIPGNRSWKLAAALVVAAVWGASAAPGDARAGSYSLAFDQAQYDVAAGGQTLVKVYLQETVGPNDTSVLATDGLTGAGFRVNFDVSPVPSSPAMVLSASDVTPASGFDGAAQSISLVAGHSAELIENVDLLSPAVTATGPGGGLYQILLGSFNFTAGSVAGETTLIQASIVPGLDSFITGTGAVLDSDIASGSSRIHVTIPNGAVPEPTSWLLMALGAAGLVGYKTARRRAR